MIHRVLKGNCGAEREIISRRYRRKRQKYAEITIEWSKISGMIGISRVFAILVFCGRLLPVATNELNISEYYFPTGKWSRIAFPASIGSFLQLACIHIYGTHCPMQHAVQLFRYANCRLHRFFANRVHRSVGFVY